MGQNVAIIGPPEEWVEAIGFPNYEVSSLGKVRRLAGYKCHKDRLLTPTNDPRFHRRYVSLSVGGKVTKRFVARLVAEAFLGLKPAGHDLHHKDGDTTNDVVGNLCYLPRTLHRSCHNRGECNNDAKLTEKEVRKIRCLYLTHSQRRLARMFGVSKTTVARVVNGDTWRHL